MPLFDLFWSMLWFFLFVAWIWLLISVFGDIFRSDMSGGAKAGWTVFVVILPWLGVVIYLIAHGGTMNERSARQAAAIAQAQHDYIRSVAGGGTSSADELAKLAELKSRGVISDREFESQKAKILS